MNLGGRNEEVEKKKFGSKINEKELLQMLGTYSTEPSVPPFHGMIMKFAWNLCSISSDFLPIPVPTIPQTPYPPPLTTPYQPSTYTTSI